MSDSNQVPEKDPVVHSSLSKPLYISAALLALCTFWALYDEVYGMRPWKSYQKRFAGLYASYLKTLTPSEEADEAKVKQTGEYKRMEKQLADLHAKLDPDMRKLETEINQILTPRIIDLNMAYQVLRSEISALTYQIEVAGSDSAKDTLRKDIDEVKKRVESVPLSEPDGSLKKHDYGYDQMEKDLAAWRARKSEQLIKLAAMRKPIMEMEARMAKYVGDRGSELSASALRLLQGKLENWDIGIRQIHVKDIDLVDRCESCHLGAREPAKLTAASMGGEKVFASHPNRDLLKLHDPERFGCSPCHNGNGVATSSIEKGHGRHKYWLWPMYYPENVQAGCQQCHVKEIVTEYATVLNKGREVFRGRGCIGCHRYEGFDRDFEELSSAGQQVRAMEQQRADYEREIGLVTRQADKAKENTEAQRLYGRADDLRVRISAINAKVEQLDMRTTELWREVKKTGPNLKEVRMKLRKEWLPVWIKDPSQWREHAKMPTFRLADEEVRAISAFIWQSGINGQAAKHPQGDAARGKESFETRGCMACHSMGEGSQRQGGDFAANLSRIGEKINYDYLVRWIENPRQRTLPYDPHEKRDLTEEDYKKNGVPFIFDVDHSKSPISGRELLVQNMTPMPDLRLSIEEIRDIATYLMSRKRDRYSFPAADYLDDPKLKARGLFLVRNYGCAGCHEITGLEEEQRIGTELTKEGSKPLERLDFALLTHDAYNEGWYNHKGFFEHKLENPAVYDKGKEKTNPLERLKMPNFKLKKDEIDAVATFLLGSVDSPMPARYQYNPPGQKQDIIDGWWVVRKYNCMGCHQVMLGQQTVFMNLKRYQDPDWKDQRPPSLIGEGARVSPVWLKQFLENPAQSTSSTDRNGVRTYLKARMPTFYLSDGELRKLVRFFEALSSQAQPYIPSKIDPITDQERLLARALFTSEGAPCLKCHATGDANHDKTATAPNFVTARERLKPGWTKRWLLDPA
ncbi:MAG: c-type cytochrome, partial [Acidobacteriia bacterium]|nr:c-type cytochrome [Terriglobia bacterium]